MVQPRTLSLVVLVALLLGAVGRLSAEDAGFKIIVHPDNPITTIDRELLRNAFLKKQSEWSDGEAMRPVNLSSKFAVHDQFTRDVLKKTPAQLKTYWNQQIFSGKGVPPPEAGSVEDLTAYVLATPGAVGYVPARADVHGAKVIEVR